MKENKNIRINSCKVILVPYEEHHVEKYHGWMESKELRELTASERLTIEEEYEMQKKWRLDDDKCTFIVLDKDVYEKSQGDKHRREIEAMVGDVNIFCSSGTHSEGEVEIMIAEPAARGKGLGREALCCMMRYALDNLKTKTFTSKIGFDNAASLHMFNSLGFQEVSKSDVFQEITMTLEASTSILEPYTPNYIIDIIK